MDYYSPEEIRELLIKFGTGYLNHTNDLFEEGNYLIQPFVRLGVYTNVEEEEENEEKSTTTSFSCQVPGCHEILANTKQYDIHYNQNHKYFCETCKKRLPSAHLLDLHVEESHDSYFAVKSQKAAIFSCYLSECNQKSWNSIERRDHCIKEHHFPSNFRFDKQPSQQQNQTKKNQKKDENVSSETAMDTTNSSSTTVVEAASQSQSTGGGVKMKNFSFGHQKVKTFAMPNNNNKDVKKESTKKTTILDENSSMMVDLMESLVDITKKD